MPSSSGDVAITPESEPTTPPLLQFTMNSLSLELIREVFSHLKDKLDIGRFRLVQRTFAHVGKEALFSCIYVQPSQNSLARLLEISRHSNCAHYVREVVLSVDAMRAMVWSSFTEQHGTKDIDKLDYRTLIVFRSLITECQEFQRSSDYVAMLSASFSRLPRLCTISLREVSPSAASYSGAVTLMDRYAHAVDPPHFHGSWGEKDHLRAFSALVDAAYFAGTAVKTFTTTGLIDQALFEDWGLLHRATKVFEKCRELKLLFCGEDPLPAIYEPPVLPRTYEKYLFEIISPAMEMEKLVVGFNVCPLAGRGGGLFRRIFGEDHVWPRLGEVVLSTIDLPYGEFLEFLVRHKKSLRVLRVRCCRLVGGLWSDAVKFLNEHSKLETIELDGAFVDGERLRGIR